MRLTLFGATGETGRLVLARALAHGHSAVAYARSPGKINTHHGRLTIVAGELDDAPAIAR